MMRFKPFNSDVRGLEYGRLYRTRDGVEVGPMRKAEDHSYFYERPCYSAAMGEDSEGETIWAIFDHEGSPIEEVAEKLGDIVAVEVRSIEEAIT